MMAASKQRNLAAFVFGLLECLLFGGLECGWASLVFILKDVGYFQKCAADKLQVTTNSNVSTGTSSNFVTSSGPYDLLDNITRETDCQDNSSALCATQDSCLFGGFTIASVVGGLVAIPAGPLVDRYSIRVCRSIFSLLICMGLVTLALSTPSTSLLLFPALSGLTMGGMVIIIANVQIGNLFISKRSTVVTIYNGAIDSSAIVLLIAKVVYEYGISLQISCYVLLAVAVVLFFINTCLLPRGRIVWPPPTKEKKTYDEDMNGRQQQDGGISSECAYIEIKDQERRKSTRRQSIKLSEAHKDVEYPTIVSAFVSPMFVFLILWMSVLEVRDLYFLGTFNTWITELVGDDHNSVSHFTNIYTLVQCAGIVVSPLSGLLLDRNKKKQVEAGKTLYQDMQSSILVFVITNALAVLFSVSVIVPVVHLQYFSFVLQVVMSAFLYGLAGSFLPIAFPTKYNATMYGVKSAAGGVFSLLQYPLFLLVQGPLKGQHYWVNVAFIGLCLSTMLFPVYIHLYLKRKKKLLEDSQGLDSTEMRCFSDEDRTGKRSIYNIYRYGLYLICLLSS